MSCTENFVIGIVSQNIESPTNPVRFSLFRYGLDYVQMAIQRFIDFGIKAEFKEILAILRKQKPDRIRVL